MNFDKFITERTLKKDDRQEITVIHNPDSRERYVKRIICDDVRYIYKTLQKLRHKNIPAIIDVSLSDCTVVIEEFIQGAPLNMLMEQHHKFTYKQINSIAKQLVSAMAELHKNNIIHRDIKLDNIIMNKQGQVWLIDYDIARICGNETRRDTTVLGTVGYAPIEQFGIMPTDYKTDIYAFGVTISRLLEYAGKKGSLYKIAGKCKRLDPAQRYQNTKQLARALRFQFLRHIGICGFILVITAAIISAQFLNRGKQTALHYSEYLGAWSDNNGIIIEMLSIEENSAVFNIKALQPNGSIRSINNAKGTVNGDRIEFVSVITDFGDTAEGTLTLENNCIYVDVYTGNMNTSASITAATIVTKYAQN